jgi:hypothetical protein
VAIDREDTLKRAETRRQPGRVDAAIAEYQRVIDAYPADSSTANTPGDLFRRTQQADKAVAQYVRIAVRLAREGFVPGALAVKRQVLRLDPRPEHARQKPDELAARQGTLVEERRFLETVAEMRTTRADGPGAAEITDA